MKLSLNTKRFRFVLQVLLGLSVGLFVLLVFLGLSVLSAKSTEVVDLKLKNRTTEAQLSALKIAKAEVKAYAYFKDIAKKVIPGDKDQDQAVVEIFELANEAGIKVAEINFPASNLGGTSSSSTAPSQTSGQTPPATNPTGSSTKSPISQTEPVAGISGLYSLKATITPYGRLDVTYDKLLAFLNRLENNRRTAQITKVDLNPTELDDGSVAFNNFSLEIYIFIKP